MTTAAIGSPDALNLTGDRLRAVQRRVVWSLVLVQTVFSVSFTMTGPLVALIAQNITGSAGKAGLAQAALYVGGVLATLPLAKLSLRRGRRMGVATGYLIGAAGAFLVVAAAQLGNYPLVLVGAATVGVSMGGGLQARFAVTDLAPRDGFGRAMGVLSWSSICGSVAGPAVIGLAGGLSAGWLPEFVAGYVVIAGGLAVSGLLVLVMMRPDPLLVALARNQAPSGPRATFRTALAGAMRIPAARHSILVLMLVHASMIALMNMAPVHLNHGPGSLGVIGLVISVHTAAMFLPGPLVGYLADRIGAQPLLLAGLGLEAAAAFLLMTVSPHDAVLVGAGLTLIGLGWAAGYLGGSVQLTASTEGENRTLAQGAADFMVQLTAAAGALSAGIIVAGWGYSGLAAIWCLLLVILLGHLVRHGKTGGEHEAPKEARSAEER